MTECSTEKLESGWRIKNTKHLIMHVSKYHFHIKNAQFSKFLLKYLVLICWILSWIWCEIFTDISQSSRGACAKFCVVFLARNSSGRRFLWHVCKSTAKFIRNIIHAIHVFYILKCFCNTALLLFFMLKFHCGWKPDCKFEDRRPNEDVGISERAGV